MLSNSPTVPNRPALRYYGGGWTRALWTISFFPEHDNYIEPCFGAGSILLRKKPVKLESVNDKDDRTVNFFRVLREKPDDLLSLINLTPWAETELTSCRKISENPLEDARRFFFLCWGNFCGGPDGGGGLRYQTSARRRFSSVTADAINREDLLVTAVRLKNVQIFNRDALEFMEKFINEDALIYFDPPYLAETRINKRVYNHEPTPAWHRLAAMMLRSAKGPVVVAGYATPLYKRIYENYGWVRVERQQKTNGKKIGTECLWLSPITQSRLQTQSASTHTQLSLLNNKETE